MQAFGFEGLKKSFDVRIAIGRARRCADNLNAGAAQDIIKSSLAEFAAAIVNQMRDAIKPVSVMVSPLATC